MSLVLPHLLPPGRTYNRSTPYLRHVIFLFRACLQTLGLSREHERDEGKAPGVQGPATNILGGPLKPSVRGSRNISTTARVLILSVSSKTRVPNTSADSTLILYMFSFLDARKVRNRLRWIGETRKMEGTSGNSLMALTAYTYTARITGA